MVNRIGIERLLQVILLVSMMALPLQLLIGSDASGDSATGTLDAWVAGNVRNGESGMLVSCQTTRSFPGNPPPPPRVEYFNGTTDSSGDFNITVNSNTWGQEPALSPIMVTVFSTYYKQMVPGKDIYTFTNFTFSGNVSTVPDGSLVSRDYPISNLSIRVINRTSGEPLPGARVELEYGDQIEHPPFPLAMATNSTGDVIYYSVRSVNTTINITKLNFMPLSDTTDVDYVEVRQGGDTFASFELAEKTWPFAVQVDSVDVNYSNPVTVDFRRGMDQTSILNPSNYRFQKEKDGTSVPFSLSARNGNRMVDIEPDQDLEFNTTYILRLDTSLKTEVGTKPLWRAMTVTFTTELPPGAIAGRVIDSSTSEPVQNERVRVIDQLSVTDSNGTFLFPLIPKGKYRVNVDRSYLYNGTSISNIIVEKGEMSSTGDIVIEPKPWGSLEVRVLSGNTPLEGAWVRIVDELIVGDEFNETTNSSGSVFFPRVLAGSVTLRVGAPHYRERGDMALVNVGGEGFLEVNLIENDLPVWVEPVDSNPDGSVLPGTDFLVHIPEPAIFTSINITIWKVDDEGFPESEVPSTLEAGGDELTYIVDPLISLPLETEYIMVVSDEMMTLSNPHRMIWRDLDFRFRTADLPIIHVNGTLLFEGQVIEGFEVTFGVFSDVTNRSGNFNISIDPESFQVTSNLVVNGSLYGYTTFTRELQLDAGEIFQAGTIVLFHVPGWYTVDPSPGSTNVQPDTMIRLNFMEPLMVPSSDRFSRLISVIPEGSNAPVAGSYSMSNGNRTVILDPANNLIPNHVYLIRISKDLMRWDNLSMFPLGNQTSFKVRPPSISISVLEPENTTSVPIDGMVRIVFSYPVDREVVEGALSLEPEVTGLFFKWVSDVELKIAAYFHVNTEYILILPGGVYGIEGEPLQGNFSLHLKTGGGYGGEHDLGTPQVFPSPEEGWKPGESIRLSGVISDSSGFQVRAILYLNGNVVSETSATIDQNGTWSVNITAPSDEGDYELSLSLSLPGGPDADVKSYDVKVGNPGAASSGGKDMTVIIILVVAIVLLIVIIAAVLYGKKQRKNAERELSGIEYTDVEGEWEDPEE